MLTWKVWANDQDLVFEGSETDARAYVVKHLSEIPDLVLESPDGDSYRYQDGGWVFLGAAGFWGPNGATTAASVKTRAGRNSRLPRQTGMRRLEEHAMSRRTDAVSASFGGRPM